MTKRKIKTGYKVVSVLNGKYYSFPGYRNRYSRVEYVIGKTSSSRSSGCGPLCVFSTLREAGDWLKAEDRIGLHTDIKCIILKVRYVPSKKDEVWESPFDFTPLAMLSSGTVLANSVKPIKVIE